MNRFLDWFNSDTHKDYIKSAIAHLWFVCIHPFDDGNGRIGRAIADMALSQAENSKMRFFSISHQINKDKKQYYGSTRHKRPCRKRHSGSPARQSSRRILRNPVQRLYPFHSNVRKFIIISSYRQEDRAIGLKNRLTPPLPNSSKNTSAHTALLTVTHPSIPSPEGNPTP